MTATRSRPIPKKKFAVVLTRTLSERHAIKESLTIGVEAENADLARTLIERQLLCGTDNDVYEDELGDSADWTVVDDRIVGSDIIFNPRIEDVIAITGPTEPSA